MCNMQCRISCYNTLRPIPNEKNAEYLFLEAIEHFQVM